jgi:hypothetical protein
MKRTESHRKKKLNYECSEHRKELSNESNIQSSNTFSSGESAKLELIMSYNFENHIKEFDSILVNNSRYFKHVLVLWISAAQPPHSEILYDNSA